MFSDRTYRRRFGSSRSEAWTARAGVGGQRGSAILLGSDEELVTNSFLQTTRSRATETSPRSTSLLVTMEESSTLYVLVPFQFQYTTDESCPARRDG